MPSFHSSSLWNKKPGRSDQEQPPKRGLTTDLDLASGLLCFGPENNDKCCTATAQCYSHIASGERQGSLNVCLRIHVKRPKFSHSQALMYQALMYSRARHFVFLRALCTKHLRIMCSRDICAQVSIATLDPHLINISINT